MSRPLLAFYFGSGIRARPAFGMLAFGVCVGGFWAGHGRWMSLTDIENLQGRKRLRQAWAKRAARLVWRWQ